MPVTDRDWPSQPPPAPPYDWPPTSFRPPAAPPTGPAPDPPRRWWIPVAAVAVVLALVGGALAAGALRRSEPIAAPATTAPPTTSPSSAAPTTPPTTSRSAPPTTAPTTTAPGTGRSGSTGGTAPSEEQVRQEVAELSRFVERERGLRFDHPVEVKVLAPEAFKDDILARLDEEQEALAHEATMLQGMGILPATGDPVASIRNLYGEGVLGYYDPKTEALVVRGDRISPFFREIVVHELTHALDDQHFGLDRPELEQATDGSDWAWSALVEGSAKKVENAYLATLSAAEHDEIAEEQMAMGAGQLGALADPSALTVGMLMMSPYDEGEPFVKALLARGGQQALDDAFADPPSTSEQVLHPEKYAARERARSVAAPPADGAVVQEGSLGELMTGYLVNGSDPSGMMNGIIDKIMSGEIDPEDVLNGTGDVSSLLKVQTIPGWGGDRYVMWRSGSSLCMRADWVADTPADLGQLQRALTTWAGKDRGAKVETPTRESVRVTRCTA